MEFELVEEAKVAKEVNNSCCTSDIWAVFSPDA